MKIMLFADAGSPHTMKWATALSDRGVVVRIFSLSPSGPFAELYGIKGIQVSELGQAISKDEGAIKKTKYLGALPAGLRALKEFKPDILHAHYASSYGLLAALTRFHPFILSVWGSDVYSFPRKSAIHKAILRFNLFRADKILSTSKAMATEARLYTRKEISITPFGVNTTQFAPEANPRPTVPNEIIVGTIKSLEDVYGINYLIEAFGMVMERLPGIALKLLIVGRGSRESEYRAQVRSLGIEANVIFTGGVTHEEVPRLLNKMDIFVALSISESFGVAVVEASACQKPVVVSNVGGLPEVVEHGVTGLIVPPRSSAAAAAAIERLIQDPQLRARMGQAGRHRVQSLYDWDDNVGSMLQVYKAMLGTEA